MSSLPRVTSVGSINFTDRSGGDDAWVGVHVEDGTIGLAASLSANGDIEVFFGRGEAEALRDALTKALELLNE